MNIGWISLHRKLLNNPIVCKDSDYIAVWIYLLLNATHSEYDTIFKGERITLKAGQLITGRDSISKHFKINSSKTQRILKKLESEQQIEQQTSNVNRLISIVNWYEYQEGEQQSEQRVNNKRTTSEQRVNTNNNVNNENNDNIGPDGLSVNFGNWTKQDFIKSIEISKKKKDYSKEMCNLFFKFWTQPDKNGKMGFQKQKTWSTGARLATWKSNNEKGFKK